MAMMPTSRSGPMMATRSNAQISELIEREATMMRRAMGRATPTLGVVLRAARNATGMASPMPSKVPSAAMLIVSQSDFHSWSR
jgi:hypothetical protein